MTDPGHAAAVIHTAREMNARGINHGTAGNVSVRTPDGMLITPSAVPYAQLTQDDVVGLGLDGSPCSGDRTPSTEWRLHATIYTQRPDVGGIVHAHSMFATTLSCLRVDIPAFHYMVAVAGGRSVRCAAYATIGTQELADAAVRALEDRTACLLANHGLVACGATLRNALELAAEVETLAAQYWRAKQAGDPIILPDREMDRVLERFRSYGRASDRPDASKAPAG